MEYPLPNTEKHSVNILFPHRIHFPAAPFCYFSSPVNCGIIVSFHDRKRISVLLENHNGMFVSDADMIACLDPAEIAVFCHRCIFAKHFITDFSTQGNTSITLTVRGFPEILPVFVCPGQTLFVSLFIAIILRLACFVVIFYSHRPCRS